MNDVDVKQMLVHTNITHEPVYGVFKHTSYPHCVSQSANYGHMVHLAVIYLGIGTCDLHLNNDKHTVTTNTTVMTEVWSVTRSFEQGD